MDHVERYYKKDSTISIHMSLIKRDYMKFGITIKRVE